METIPVVQVVSHATRAIGSHFNISSSIASEIWSQTLSGCPSVTDSDVKNFLLILKTLSFVLYRYFTTYTLKCQWRRYIFFVYPFCPAFLCTVRITKRTIKYHLCYIIYGRNYVIHIIHRVIHGTGCPNIRYFRHFGKLSTLSAACGNKPKNYGVNITKYPRQC